MISPQSFKSTFCFIQEDIRVYKNEKISFFFDADFNRKREHFNLNWWGKKKIINIEIKIFCWCSMCKVFKQYSVIVDSSLFLGFIKFCITEKSYRSYKGCFYTALHNIKISHWKNRVNLLICLAISFWNTISFKCWPFCLAHFWMSKTQYRLCLAMLVILLHPDPCTRTMVEIFRRK